MHCEDQHFKSLHYHGVDIELNGPINILFVNFTHFPYVPIAIKKLSIYSDRFNLLVLDFQVPIFTSLGRFSWGKGKDN